VVVVACGRAASEAAPVPQPLPASPVATASTPLEVRAFDRAEVLAFCERYRTAMEARDAAALMALVSKRYDDDGTTYETLARTMHRLLAAANQIRYEIRYGDITTRADGAIEVDFAYSASFLTASGWQHRVDESKLVLERREASFAILSGM
jgi:hypothetical protein